MAPLRSTRAMASICCSPPDSRVPGKSRALAQHRELVVDLLQASRPTPAGDRREQEVLLDRERGVDAAVVGHPARARGGPARRG